LKTSLGILKQNFGNNQIPLPLPSQNSGVALYCLIRRSPLSIDATGEVEFAIAEEKSPL